MEREAKRRGGFEVNDQLELMRLLHRQVGRLDAFENLVDIVRGTSSQVIPIYGIGHETTGLDRGSYAEHRWQLLCGREIHDELFVLNILCMWMHIEGVNLTLSQGGESLREIFSPVYDDGNGC